MIVSWNVRGCNKIAKIKEINSRLRALKPYIAILVETRIKQDKAKKLRARLEGRWNYINNYASHLNGRIWILWDPTKINIQVMNEGTQYIHCRLSRLDGSFITWITAVYALNRIEDRCRLWTHLESLQPHTGENWMLLGDFNNVLSVQDRVGGTRVHPNEFKDLVDMMDRVDLHEVDSIGEHYTWHNKHTTDPIYSRID